MSDDIDVVPVVLVVAPLVVLWALAVFDILARRPDLSAAGKGAWMAIVVLVPYFGVLLYAGLRTPRPPQGTGQDDGASTAAVRRLTALADDHAAGRIDDHEFAREKAAVFGLEAPSA